MANKIRLGFVGANVNSTWASQSHFPALLASPDVEFTATCTTRPESAEEARQAFGAKLAFHDFRAMVVSPEIDAVAVVVRVPSHYEATKAAIEAGKHVYTEWPLGRNTAEAEELAALARDKGVQTAVGLQSRVSPALLYIKEQIEAGYVGEALSCHVTTMRDGTLERPSSRTWQRDASLGANTLTIANGHVIDALRFVAGNFTRVAYMVSTQVKQLYETDTQQYVEVTSPDDVRVSGQLASGAAAAKCAAGPAPSRGWLHQDLATLAPRALPDAQACFECQNRTGLACGRVVPNFARHQFASRDPTSAVVNRRLTGREPTDGHEQFSTEPKAPLRADRRSGGRPADVPGQRGDS